MSDPRKSADDAAFERELAEASRAYRAADGSHARGEPPASVDEAIRAAARRAVQAAPRPAQKPWLLRFSKPLSVAAVLVLTASLVIVMKQEQPDMVPSLPGKVGKIALPPAAPAEALEEVIPPKPAGQADRLATARPAHEVARSAPAAAPGAGERMALAPVPERAELAKRAVPAERIVPAITPVPVPVPEVQIAAPPAFSPPAAPPAYASAAPTPAPAAVATITANAADQARERRADSANATSAAKAAGAAPVALAKQEAAGFAAPAPAATAPRAAGAMIAETKQALPMLRSQAAGASVMSQATPAPALKVTGEAADMAKAVELPEAWLKRIIELRKQMKSKEADEELVRFRKAYPDYVIPPELKASVAR